MRKAIDAGAIGFATSKSPTHSGAWGKPVPSRLAEKDEVFRIAAALKDAGRGIVQATPGVGLFLDELAELAKHVGRPVSWTALLTGLFGRGKAVDLVERTAALGGEVWPQVACRPIVMQLTLADPFPFARAKAFTEVLALPHDERAALYVDAA